MRRALLAAAFSLLLFAPCEGEEAKEKFQTVKVKPGDTLWAIANRFLKDPARWDEVLKHNKQLSKDPTVALPGMVLRVPTALIRDDMLAARLEYSLNRVRVRKKDAALWEETRPEMSLFRDDSVRTYKNAKASVRFLNDDLLILDPDSMAVIKPVNRDYDLELTQGGLFVGRAKVLTPSAKITPKTDDTKYSAKIAADLSTLVEVYTGKAEVEAEGEKVDVLGGMATKVTLGLSPSVPMRIPNLPAFEARAAEYESAMLGVRPGIRIAAPGGGAPSAGGLAPTSVDMVKFQADLDELAIGQPISGYHVQFSEVEDFSSLLLDKVFEAGRNINLAEDGLSPGTYWVRAASIDLLGFRGKFTAPKRYTYGMRKQKVSPKTMIRLIRPSKDETVDYSNYRVLGRVKAEGLTVLVNGARVRWDESGNFSSVIMLEAGPNVIRLSVSDPQGNTGTETRTVTYKP